MANITLCVVLIFVGVLTGRIDGNITGSALNRATLIISHNNVHHTGLATGGLLSHGLLGSPGLALVVTLGGSATNGTSLHALDPLTVSVVLVCPASLGQSPVLRTNADLSADLTAGQHFALSGIGHGSPVAFPSCQHYNITGSGNRQLAIALAEGVAVNQLGNISSTCNLDLTVAVQSSSSVSSDGCALSDGQGQALRNYISNTGLQSGSCGNGAVSQQSCGLASLSCIEGSLQSQVLLIANLRNEGSIGFLSFTFLAVAVLVFVSAGFGDLNTLFRLGNNTTLTSVGHGLGAGLATSSGLSHFLSSRDLGALVATLGGCAAVVTGSLAVFPFAEAMVLSGEYGCLTVFANHCYGAVFLLQCGVIAGLGCAAVVTGSLAVFPFAEVVGLGDDVSFIVSTDLLVVFTVVGPIFGILVAQLLVQNFTTYGTGLILVAVCSCAGGVGVELGDLNILFIERILAALAGVGHGLGAGLFTSSGLSHFLVSNGELFLGVITLGLNGLDSYECAGVVSCALRVGCITIVLLVEHIHSLTGQIGHSKGNGACCALDLLHTAIVRILTGSIVLDQDRDVLVFTNHSAGVTQGHLAILNGRIRHCKGTGSIQQGQSDILTGAGLQLGNSAVAIALTARSLILYTGTNNGNHQNVLQLQIHTRIHFKTGTTISDFIYWIISIKNKTSCEFGTTCRSLIATSQPNFIPVSAHKGFYFCTYVSICHILIRQRPQKVIFRTAPNALFILVGSLTNATIICKGSGTDGCNLNS